MAAGTGFVRPVLFPVIESISRHSRRTLSYTEIADPEDQTRGQSLGLLPRSRGGPPEIPTTLIRFPAPYAVSYATASPSGETTVDRGPSASVVSGRQSAASLASIVQDITVLLSTRT